MVYYIKVSDETTFWNAMHELIDEGCDFRIGADANNRHGKFVAGTFWVDDIGCKSYDIVMKHKALLEIQIRA